MADMTQRRRQFLKGLRTGWPVFLGYLPVSFAFAVWAVGNGLPWQLVLLISMTNLTSAGQFAGLALIVSGGLYLEVAVTTFVINIRYMLMSLSLSQKLDPRMSTWKRCVLAFGNTDEIFAVAMQQQGEVNAQYLTGLILTPYFGWAAGTLLGATATGFLPASVRSALGIAIYGMFIAILVPAARSYRPVLLVAVCASALSCLFHWAPVLSRVSRGFVIILCALIAAGLGAKLFPISEKEEQT